MAVRTLRARDSDMSRVLVRVGSFSVRILFFRESRAGKGKTRKNSEHPGWIVRNLISQREQS